MPDKRKILAVDDNISNNEIVEEILSNEYELKIATSGEQALEILGDFKPDIILLDIMMPELDGYDTCLKIRENPDMKDVTIIMVSAKGMASDMYKGHEVGADDYITKPFSQEQLLESIEFFVEQKVGSDKD